jgi:hypothetical protein
VVRVLATGPNVRGFKLRRGRWFLMVIKIRSMISFRGEVKPSETLRHQRSLQHERILVGQIHAHFSQSFLLLRY